MHRDLQIILRDEYQLLQIGPAFLFFFPPMLATLNGQLIELPRIFN